MLPPKYKSIKSRIEKAPKREFPKHRKWVRTFSCSIAGCSQGPIQFAHIRLGTDGAMSLKPHDMWGISLCQTHHTESHNIGEESFARKYGINLHALAMEFASKSPVLEVREYAKQRMVA